MIAPLLLLALAAAAPATFRLDYFHTGSSREERFSLDRVVVEPAPWPGNPALAIDETNRLLYSRGFSSIYGDRAFRDAASFAPYDHVEILVNSRTYGGGGIFNLYSTVAADSLWAPYLFIHEFGHHFAGLADEYYTSDTAYAPAAERIEPWERNATALLAADAVKWKAQAREIQKRRKQLRAANRPEAEMDALFQEQLAAETRLLSADPAFPKVGAFEGAGPRAR